MTKQSHRAAIVAAISILLASSAYATTKEPPPKTPDPTAIAGAAAGARADVGDVSPSADSGGNVFKPEYRSDYRSEDRAYALALPGQTAAPAVAGDCLEHKRGGSGLSIGVSGSTRLNEPCLERRHCLDLADRYAAWGQVALAVRQLATCDGVDVGDEPALVYPLEASTATHDGADPTATSSEASCPPAPEAAEVCRRLFEEGQQK